MKKYFVQKGLYAGETVVIVGESCESSYVIAQPIDDHGKNCGEEVSIHRDYLTELS